MLQLVRVQLELVEVGVVVEVDNDYCNSYALYMKYSNNKMKHFETHITLERTIAI